MQALSEYIKADKSSLISLKEKLVVNKNYKNLDSNELKKYLADIVELKNWLTFNKSGRKTLSEKVYDSFSSLWQSFRDKPDEWNYIVNNNVKDKVQNFVKEFDKYDHAYFCANVYYDRKDNGRMTKIYHLFDELEKRGFDIVNLVDNNKTEIRIRYVLYNDIVVFQYGRDGNTENDILSTYIACKGDLYDVEY